MKNFEDFRNNVLTDQEVHDIIELSKIAADKTKNQNDWMASFSATFSLQMLSQYHEWINQD